MAHCFINVYFVGITQALESINYIGQQGQRCTALQWKVISNFKSPNIYCIIPFENFLTFPTKYHWRRFDIRNEKQSFHHILSDPLPDYVLHSRIFSYRNQINLQDSPFVCFFQEANLIWHRSYATIYTINQTKLLFCRTVKLCNRPVYVDFLNISEVNCPSSVSDKEI